MSRVLNRPLLMDPGYARTFFAGLSSRIGINRVYDIGGQVEEQEKLRIRASSYTASRDRDRPYKAVDGIAVIPIDGTLVNKYGYVKPHSGMTGYDGILARASDAFNDPDIRAVLLDNDTPGGDVAGCFDCTKSLREMATASGKPMWSLAYDMNCSGGMALASAASRRLITSTGIAGSVGVIMAHGNYEKALETQGVDVTLIYAGAHKVDGNPYGALSDEVYERFLAETVALRQEFAELVGSNIGMDVEKVLATEALSYRGQDAVNAGLADQVVNGNQAIQIFSDYLSSQGRTLSTIGASMSIQDNKGLAAKSGETDSAASSTQTQETNVSESQPAVAAESTSENVDQGELKKQAATQERERIQGILKCEEASTRPALANHLATNTDMSVVDAQGVLGAAAEEGSATRSASALDAVMSAEAEPSIGLDTGTEQTEDEDVSKSVSLFKQARGIKA